MIYFNFVFLNSRLGAVSLKQYRAVDLLMDPKPMIETPTFANKTGYLFSLYYTSVCNIHIKLLFVYKHYLVLVFR